MTTMRKGGVQTPDITVIKKLVVGVYIETTNREGSASALALNRIRARPNR